MTDTLHQSEPITHRFEKILNRNAFGFPIPPCYFYPLIHTKKLFLQGKTPVFARSSPRGAKAGKTGMDYALA